MKVSRKETSEAWQVPVEKDGRRAKPAWVADFHLGRIPSEKAIVQLTGLAVDRVDAMPGDWVLVADDKTVTTLSAEEFDAKYVEVRE